MSLSQAADPKPLPPDKPDPGDCCGGGCVRCVYDVYEDALERHQAELAAWRARHPSAASGDPQG
jgi:hypothetical protein